MPEVPLVQARGNDDFPGTGLDFHPPKFSLFFSSLVKGKCTHQMNLDKCKQRYNQILTKIQSINIAPDSSHMPCPKPFSQATAFLISPSQIPFVSSRTSCEWEQGRRHSSSLSFMFLPPARVVAVLASCSFSSLSVFHCLTVPGTVQPLSSCWPSGELL